MTPTKHYRTVDVKNPPKESGKYITNNGELYYFKEENNWFVDDSLEDEVPHNCDWWLEEYTPLSGYNREQLIDAILGLSFKHELGVLKFTVGDAHKILNAILPLLISPPLVDREKMIADIAEKIICYSPTDADYKNPATSTDKVLALSTEIYNLFLLNDRGEEKKEEK